MALRCEAINLRGLTTGTDSLTLAPALIFLLLYRRWQDVFKLLSLLSVSIVLVVHHLLYNYVNETQPQSLFDECAQKSLNKQICTVKKINGDEKSP